MRWLKLSIGLATTAGFVWLLAREVDLDALGRAFAGLSVSTVLLALAFLAAGRFQTRRLAGRGPAPRALRAQDVRTHRSVGRRLGLRGGGVRDRIAPLRRFLQHDLQEG